jgi:hypothetical protein
MAWLSFIPTFLNRQITTEVILLLSLQESRRGSSDTDLLCGASSDLG